MLFPFFVCVYSSDDPAARWEALLEDTPLFGGVHFVEATNYNPLSYAYERSSHVHAIHQNNYIHKMMLALQLAETRHYEFMFNFDDDIFMPPQVLQYMLENTHVLATISEQQQTEAQEKEEHIHHSSGSGGNSGSSGNSLGCYYLTPTLSSGIPTVGMWAKAFLSKEQQQMMGECYAGRILRCLLTPSISTI